MSLPLLRCLYFSVCLVLPISNSLAQERLGFTLPPGKTTVQFPIQIYNNLVVVPLVINDKLPLNFILDTGAGTSILTEKAYSDILKLPYFKKYTITGVGSNQIVDAYVANNVSIDLPGIQGRGQTILVLDQDFLQLRNYLGAEVHGILGYDFFSRFLVKVDYARKQLTVMQPDRFTNGKKYECLKMQVENSKPFINVSLEINGKIIEAKLLVDSGASHSLFLEASTEGPIALPDFHLKSILGRGLGGDIMGNVAKVKSIKIGNHTLFNVLACFPDLSNNQIKDLSNGFVHRNGSIGGEILSRFTVVYNFPQEKIYLRKNANFNRTSNFNLSGITVMASGPQLKEFIVTHVHENSPALQSGIQVNDLIAGINNHDTSKLTLSDVIRFLNSRPGKSVNLKINRNGNLMHKKFKLQQDNF